MLYALLALPPVVLLGFGLRVRAFARGLDPAPRGEAIVVLGARLFPGGTPSPAFLGRIERAVELFHAGAAPLVVFSGGTAGAGPSEARAALAHARALGLDAGACLLEEESRSTAENARYTAALLKARGIARVVLVTDGFHLLRAARWFAACGLEPVPAASRRRLTLRTELLATLREALAYLRAPPGWG